MPELGSDSILNQLGKFLFGRVPNERFDNFLFGEGPKIQQLQNLTPGQQQFHGNILEQLQQMLNPGGGFQQAQQYHQNILGGPDAFQNFSQPYLQQFQEQILPQIAERFAGAGALSSSGFGQALGGATSGLQSQLAQLFSQLQQQSAQQQTGQFNQLGQFGLGTDTFSHYEKPGSAGLVQPLLTAFLKSYGEGLGGSFFPKSLNSRGV